MQLSIAHLDGKVVWKARPHKHRDHNILQACSDKVFYLQFTNGKMESKRTNKY